METVAAVERRAARRTPAEIPRQGAGRRSRQSARKRTRHPQRHTVRGRAEDGVLRRGRGPGRETGHRRPWTPNADTSPPRRTGDITQATIRSGLRSGKQNPRAVPRNFFDRTRAARPRPRQRGDGVGHLRIRATPTTVLRLRRRVSGARRGRIGAEDQRGARQPAPHAHASNVLELIQYSPTRPYSPTSRWPNTSTCPTACWKWKTGDLLPHSPDYLSTVQLPVEYDPDASCPDFEVFIAEVLPPDLLPCRPPTAQGSSGNSSATPSTRAIRCTSPSCCTAAGRNGKGTLIRVLKALLGRRNCSAVGLHDWSRTGSAPPPCSGKLANLAGDLDSKWLDNTAAFKAITGGDLVQAEYKYGAAFDFTPWALPFYSINKPFGSADSLRGLGGPLVVVPFPTVPRPRPGPRPRRDCSQGRASRVVARGVEALPALMARGHCAPGSLTAAKTAFIVASDAVRAWVDESCDLNRRLDAAPRPVPAYRTYRDTGKAAQRTRVLQPHRTDKRNPCHQASIQRVRRHPSPTCRRLLRCRESRRRSKTAGLAAKLPFPFPQVGGLRMIQNGRNGRFPLPSPVRAGRKKGRYKLPFLVTLEISELGKRNRDGKTCRSICRPNLPPTACSKWWAAAEQKEVKR